MDGIRSTSPYAHHIEVQERIINCNPFLGAQGAYKKYWSTSCGVLQYGLYPNSYNPNL